MAADRTRQRRGYRAVEVPEGEPWLCDRCEELLFFGERLWLRRPWGGGGNGEPNVRCDDCARALGIGKQTGWQAKGKAEARDREAIIELLAHDGEATAAEIAETLDVPARTIRRRLDGLVTDGLVTRTEEARAGRRGRRVTYRKGQHG